MVHMCTTNNLICSAKQTDSDSDFVIGEVRVWYRGGGRGDAVLPATTPRFLVNVSF